jgi:hypothetical protein
MTRRSGRGHIKVTEVLEKLASGRAGAIQAHREAKIGSKEYKRASAALDAIDDLTETLTGDRTHFHAKPGTTAPRQDNPTRHQTTMNRKT